MAKNYMAEVAKMRLIDADALIKKMKHWKEHEVSDGLIGEGIKAGYDAAMICVSEMPTVEERKHGHWVTGENEDDGDFIIKCSICGKRAPTDGDYRYYLSNYCPHCGATMDEVAEDEVRQNK